MNYSTDFARRICDLFLLISYMLGSKIFCLIFGNFVTFVTFGTWCSLLLIMIFAIFDDFHIRSMLVPSINFLIGLYYLFISLFVLLFLWYYNIFCCNVVPFYWLCSLFFDVLYFLFLHCHFVYLTPSPKH